MNPQRGCPDCEQNVEFFGLQAESCDLCREEEKQKGEQDENGNFRSIYPE